MGELATWSAVKTKVGLGKDGTEIPTKAELLALAPTGNGENYIALELSNSALYGNNEGVKLEDIHKVTYKYTFEISDPVINFYAIGGDPYPTGAGISPISSKEKYLDDIATDIKEDIGWVSLIPEWAYYDEKGIIKATENFETSQRFLQSYAIQDETDFSIPIYWYQDAAISDTRYVWSITPTSLHFGPNGGTQDLTITSYKQETRNGKDYGDPVYLGFLRRNVNGLAGGSGNQIVFPENKSESVRSDTATFTQNETNRSITISCTQSAGYKVYGDLSVSNYGTITDIPASGGTRSSLTTLPIYSQTWGWNGSTTGGGTITSGANISYGSSVTAPSLGTTEKVRTEVGSLSFTISLNGKSYQAVLSVYQAANYIVENAKGTPVINAYPEKYTLPNTGGTSRLYGSVRIPTTDKWASGSTSVGNPVTGAPSFSSDNLDFKITLYDGSDWVGFIVTVLENTDESTKNAIITASYPGAADVKITIEQGAALVEYQYTFRIL